jgi:DNA polymerase (family X)
MDRKATLPVQNAEIAAVFGEIADLLEVERANPFRIRAYRNAARTISDLGRSVAAMAERGDDLDKLPGIGKDLAARISEIVSTGRCGQLERLRRQVPGNIVELLKLPGLGPRRVRTLHHELGVRTVEQLHAAAVDGRVRGIPGFGPRTEQAIAEATAARLRLAQRVPLTVAAQAAVPLLAALEAMPGVQRAVIAGSLRRRMETVGDLDLLVTAQDGSAVVDRFVQLGDVDRVLASGSTKASVVLRTGLQVDLRSVDEQSFGAAWLYFTGSKAHNIALRRLAKERGHKLNEYGLFKGRRRSAGVSEQEVYQALGLRFIEPELREDRGEIEAARQGQLPELVDLGDLRGDLHVHTRESDGKEALEAMVEAARARGLHYLAVTEHSQRLSLTHGVDAVRLARQIDKVDRLNERLHGFTVLKGIEVDILDDGELDLPDSILQRLDLVIGAVHHRLGLPRAKQTDRVLRAMDHRCFTLLAHPTGRLLGEREACAIDLPKVLRRARQRGCFVELNGQPQRLDLNDTACQMAKTEGVMVAINSDAHSGFDFDHLQLGIGQARRGWLERDDVLNTRSLEALRPLLARTMR